MDRRIQNGIFLLVFLIAGLAIYGLIYTLCFPRKAVVKADVHITAPQLIAAFERNEGLADSTYLYKVVSVRGVLHELVANGESDHILRIAGNHDQKTMIDCHLDTLFKQEVPNLRSGDSVTIMGTCTGRWLNIILVQCIVEK